MADDEPGGTLDRMSDFDPTGAGDGLRDTVPVKESPAPLGALPARYQDLGLLGRGGMGEVRLCADTAIGREIAVKLARDEATEEDRERFVREALVQARLEHPAIVPVYDIGALGSDQPFFTMKRISGAELCDANLSRHRLLAAFVLVCQAVEHAHSRGVLHRDLKPANIMVGELGEVYVLDWGLAKLGDAVEPGHSPGHSINSGEITSGSTRADVILGTPGYISPERLRGDGGDHRADIFALGCILYEVLARQPLIPGKTVDGVLAATVAGDAAARRIAALETEVGPELAAICRRATALDPGDRHDSAGELGREVERYLEGDRDQARRRELAAAAAGRAGARIEAAIAGDDRARREALAGLGEALALDPENTAARGALVTLLVTPPPEVPRSVEDEVEAGSMERIAMVSRMAASAFALTALGLVAAVAAMGVERWLWVSGTFGALVGLTGLCALQGWGRIRSFSLYLLIIAAIAVLLISVSRLVSPVLVAPVIGPGYAMLLSMHHRDVAVYLALAATILAVSIPLLLELGGLVSPTFDLAGGALVILPQSIELPPLATPIVLWVVFIGAFVGPTAIIKRFKNELLAAERRARMQAWQLEQLVPNETRR